MRRTLKRARLLAIAVLLPLAALAASAVPAGAAPPTGTAADGPGALAHFDLARKDCVGTARNRMSKVWFTVADGVLSDVYYPTNDTTESETPRSARIFAARWSLLRRMPSRRCSLPTTSEPIARASWRPMRTAMRAGAVTSTESTDAGVVSGTAICVVAR